MIDDEIGGVGAMVVAGSLGMFVERGPRGVMDVRGSLGTTDVADKIGLMVDAIGSLGISVERG